MSRRRLTTIPGEVPRHTLAHQAQIAEAEVALKTWRLAQPWMCGLLAFGLAALLHYMFAGTSTLIMVAGAGLLITLVDWHLRSTRKYLIARLIGPVATLATTAGMVWLIAFGFSKPLLRAWLIGGILLSVIWDIWMMSGHHKDDARGFGAVADSAGLPGMRFIQQRKSRSERKAGRREAISPGIAAAAGSGIEGVLQFPHGKTMEDVTQVLGNLESASDSKRGSWTVSPHPDSRQARVRIDDPEVLDTRPLPWPGPSAEGESIALPVRPALMQTGAPLLYDLRNHHALTMGVVGSGKSMGWAWNVLADSVTRYDFACLAADLNKGRQFLGPLEPALHSLAASEDEVLEMLSGISRIATARVDYMAKNQLTEWSEGCGLSFLECWWEEAADIADLVEAEKKMAALKSLIRSFRSLGIRLDMSTQRSDFEEIPTFIRSQLARVCFGVENDDDAKFGLTTRQRRLGCAPQDWQARLPGKFYIDAPTIPETLIAMPMRGWYWRGAQELEAHAVTWPASDRPLDDVSGEAWEAKPGRAASTAFPVLREGTRERRPEQAGPPRLHVVGQEETAPVQQRFAGRNQKLSADEARQRIRAQVEDWRCEGKTRIMRREIDPMVKRMGYSTTWGHGVIGEMETEGVLRKCTDKRPAYWEIVAQADAGEVDS